MCCITTRAFIHIHRIVSWTVQPAVLKSSKNRHQSSTTCTIKSKFLSAAAESYQFRSVFETTFCSHYKIYMYLIGKTKSRIFWFLVTYFRTEQRTTGWNYSFNWLLNRELNIHDAMFVCQPVSDIVSAHRPQLSVSAWYINGIQAIH